MQGSTNQTVINIVWGVFVIAVILIVIFTARVAKRRAKGRAKAKAEYQSFKQEYEYLTPAKIDACKDENLPGAVIMECQRKENEDENYLAHLNPVELTVYGIYNVNMSLSSSIGLRSFFITPANEYYVAHIEEIFNNVAAPKIAQLMHAAKHLNDVMENDLDDEENDEYARYNFSDFTQEYKGMITGTDFQKKVISYIRKNKDEFKGEENETSR